MRNEVKFKEYMALLCETFDKTMSKLLTDLYWKVLEPFDDAQCEAAFKELIYSSRFFPKPADFIEVLRGKKADRAMEAWCEVLGTVKHVGNYQSVKFADPVIHSVINVMGGWDRLAGTMTLDEEKWKQKEFERLYSVMEKRGNHPEYLPGAHEVENNARGYEEKQEIVEIGFSGHKQIA